MGISTSKIRTSSSRRGGGRRGSARRDLDAFDGKISRKLENTLGLFIAINGFTPNAIELQSARGSRMILADGGDLMAVLEQRIRLDQLLSRKRRHAPQTGEVFLSAFTILSQD